MYYINYVYFAKELVKNLPTVWVIDNQWHKNTHNKFLVPDLGLGPLSFYGEWGKKAHKCTGFRVKL